MEKVKIGGMMQSDHRALIRIAGPDGGDDAARFLSGLGRAGVNIELTAQIGSDGAGRSVLGVVIDQQHLNPALDLLRDDLGLDPGRFGHTADVAVLSLFGPHLREKPLVPGLALEALSRAEVRPLAVATSISSVSVVVPGSALDRSADALLAVFEAPFQVARRPRTY
jgi:aspartokinase